ncbi:TolB family protein [Dokdonella koreensis]|uniref:WD40 domain protein beta Propeller n=1 Tax=Dokdonella koreensis DS-123 TaxID=1300342 RepID=A0A160DY99_9GAMM|nr:hypothetical protein [Dokdonella koreensis]ANB19351.1 WD40 domain protein beta Propeller [Dokdonella koreensis DS-123]
MDSNRLLIAVLAASLAGSADAALTVGPPMLETYGYEGEPSYGPCGNAVLSDDAHWLTFSCFSRDIVPGDDNDRYDTFLLDRQTRQTQRVSVDSLGQEHRFDSNRGVASADGRRVVFNSNAKLDPSIPWDYYKLGISNVFLRDLERGTTSLIGLNSRRESERLGTRLVTAHHRREEVLLLSGANLLGEDTNGPLMEDLYVRNWRTAAIELVSTSTEGHQGNCYTQGDSIISDSGRYIVFMSCASNLSDDNPLRTGNLFLRDRWLGTTRRLTRPWTGGEFIASPSYYLDSTAGRIIGDRYVPFGATSGELVPGVGTIQANTYLLDIQTGQIELISRGWDGSTHSAEGWRPSMSADGRYLAFYSRSPDIMVDPGPGPAVYLKDRFTGETVNVTATLARPLYFYFAQVNLSADGSTLAFTWRYDDDAPQPYAGRQLIYTVSIHGTPIAPPEPEPVPATAPMARFAAFVALLLGAWIALRRRRNTT